MVRGNLNRWTLWANLFGNDFGYSLFALSTRFIDPGIGAVLIETWPLMAMFLIVGLMRGHAPRRLKVSTLGLCLLSFAGAASVSLSQQGSAGVGADAATVVGALLALGGAFGIALSSTCYRWAADVAPQLARPTQNLNLFLTVVSIVIASTGATTVNAITSALAGEYFAIAPLVYGALAGFGGSSGAIAWRRANIIGANVGINCLAYLTPRISRACLHGLHRVDVGRPEFRLSGAAVILTANIMINIERQLPGRRLFRRWMNRKPDPVSDPSED